MLGWKELPNILILFITDISYLLPLLIINCDGTLKVVAASGNDLTF